MEGPRESGFIGLITVKPQLPQLTGLVVSQWLVVVNTVATPLSTGYIARPPVAA